MLSLRTFHSLALQGPLYGSRPQKVTLKPIIVLSDGNEHTEMPYSQELESEEKRPVRESSMEKSKAGRGLRFSPSGTVRCRVVGLVDRGQRSSHKYNTADTYRTHRNTLSKRTRARRIVFDLLARV